MTERHSANEKKYYVSRFQADFLNLKGVINDALAFYDSAYAYMDEASRLELKVVLNELLINAIKHGCGPETDCYVKVVAGMIEEDCALLIVEDDGAGYDTARLCARRESDVYDGGFDDFEETGRGINIVKNLCDDFMVNEKGNKVVLNKRLHRAVAV